MVTVDFSKSQLWLSPVDSKNPPNKPHQQTNFKIWLLFVLWKLPFCSNCRELFGYRGMRLSKHHMSKNPQVCCTIPPGQNQTRYWFDFHRKQKLSDISQVWPPINYIRISRIHNSLKACQSSCLTVRYTKEQIRKGTFDIWHGDFSS